MNDYNHQLDSLDENCWAELIDYGSLLDNAVPPTDLYLNPSALDPVVETDASLSVNASHASECAEEQECPRKRGRNDQCGGTGTKACRERMRREKLNDRFSELCAVLDPGRPAKTDKSAILGDAIRVINQLKNESREFKEMNDKLLEEIQTLKAEKNELREEKLVLKADKQKIEQQLEMLGTGFVPAVYPPPPVAVANKMPLFPSYSYVPMWQYMPPSARDTSQDHHLRPPAA